MESKATSTLKSGQLKCHHVNTFERYQGLGQMVNGWWFSCLVPWFDGHVRKYLPISSSYENQPWRAYANVKKKTPPSFTFFTSVHMQVPNRTSLNSLKDLNIHLWTYHIPNLFSVSSAMLSILSNEEIRKANRFHFKKDYIRYIYSHFMLRKVLSYYTRSPAEQLVFDLNKYGKPFLKDCNNVRFNLSHTEDVFIIAVSHHGEIGVDIEKCKQIENLEQVAKKIMTGGEFRLFLNCDVNKRIHFFFKCWVRKEALVKAIGEGLTMDLSNVTVLGNNLSLYFTDHSNERHSGLIHWSINDIDFDIENIAGAVCVEAAPGAQGASLPAKGFNHRPTQSGLGG